MASERTIILICRGHSAHSSYSDITEQGKRELKKVADTCTFLGVRADNCELFSSPSPEEQASAGSLKMYLELDSFQIISWLNNSDAPFRIVSEGLLHFSEKAFILFILDKPILEHLATFCGVPSYSIHSGDVFVCHYPSGKMQKSY